MVSGLGTNILLGCCHTTLSPPPPLPSLDRIHLGVYKDNTNQYRVAEVQQAVFDGSHGAAEKKKKV